MKPRPTTRYRQLTRRQAGWVLAGLLLLWGTGYALTYHLGVWSIGSPSFADEPYHLGVIAKLRNGEPYYPSANAMLESQGMSRASTFNWRLPTYAYFCALFPTDDGPVWILGILALVSIVGIVKTCFTRDLEQLAAMVLLCGGTLAWNVYEPTTYLQTEPWCEVFLLLAITAYARGWWPVGVACIATAMSLRELAVPLGFAAFALSLYSRHREAIAWVVVLGLWFVGYYLHVRAIATVYDATSPTAASWLNPTGLTFVIHASSMNIFVRMMPNILKSLVFALSILGLIGWRNPMGLRMIANVAVYLLPFLFIWGGDYWGCIFSALLMVGLIHSPLAVRDLILAVRRIDS